ncbi:MAG TPA: prepilin peptidase [Desulfobacteraceae bacterium]|nr:prepilin peptidase [Desulfobacteraceae bacterium]
MSGFIARPWGTEGVYPEREEWRRDAGGRSIDAPVRTPSAGRRPKPGTFGWIVDAAAQYRGQFDKLTDAQLLLTADALRPRLRREGLTRELVAQAFALVREAAGRHLGIPHFDVQLIGGQVLLSGMVAEMETGEGKTLVATLPACTLALVGVPVHIITVNDYLAARDAQWMGPVYQALGLSVGTIVHGKDPAARREAYRCDVTYCTNKEVAFDYLRDRLVLSDRPTRLRLSVERLYGDASRLKRLVMRGLPFAIVDEADSVLVDEARTPLIISSQAEGLYGETVYRMAMNLAKTLVAGKDFIVYESDRNITLVHRGRARVLASDWTEASANINDKQKEQLVRQGLTALHLFRRDQHYLVKDGKVQIIDEYTGRLMADRSWEMGLHQLIEVKEGCEVTLPKQTLARISYQRFFRRYLGLAGMTGTAREVARELWAVYRLPVVAIQTNRPVRRTFWPDRVFATQDEKWRAVVDVIAGQHEKGRPVLVGTRSVEASEHLSRLLDAKHLPHRVLNARQDKEEAKIIAEAGMAGCITVATNMAGRGTDIRLGDGIAERGGLFVIATERHEAGRIDRQLFGRCGRQGDPGTCVAMVALDDELVATHAPPWLRIPAVLTARLHIGFLSRWIGALVFRAAQRSAQRLHSRMRRNLLKMDDQVGESLAFSGRPE